MMNKKIKYSGFSLVELSIVLVIISFIIGSGLLIIKRYSAESKYDQTHARMMDIMNDLKQYALKNQALPCPADGTLRNSDPAFGIGTIGTTCATGNSNVGSGAITSGMLPVSSLAMPLTAAVDAWGNRFTYVVVDPVRLKDAMANPTNATKVGSVPSIAVYNFKGAAQMNAAGAVVVLLISHGENGYGAYPANGGSQRAKPSDISGAEDANTALSNLSYRSSEPFKTFDDILYYWTFNQIIDPKLMEYK